MNTNRLKGFLLCSFISLNLSAFSQVQLGLFAGPQTTSAKYTISEERQPAEYKYGFQAGATLKVPFESQLYFAPAVYYSMKGYRVTLNKPSFPPTQLAINNDVQVHTIETAILLNYDFSANPSHFFFKGGMAIDYALSGNETFELKNGQVQSRAMKFAYSEYGRFTAQAIAHFGYETTKGFFIFGHYAHGMGSMNNADNGPQIKHRVFGISFGKYLNKKGR